MDIGKRLFWMGARFILIGFIVLTLKNEADKRTLDPNPVPDICDTGAERGAESCRKLVVDMDVDILKPTEEEKHDR